MRFYSNIITVVIKNIPFYTDEHGKEILLIDEAFIKNFLKYYRIIDRSDAITFKRKKNLFNETEYRGYIKFQSLDEARNLIMTSNFTIIDSFSIQMWINDEKSKKMMKSGKGRIVIKNLPADIEANQLYESLSLYGKIIACDVRKEKDGASNSAVLCFRKEKDAKKAVSSLEGSLFNGNPVEIHLLDSYR